MTTWSRRQRASLLSDPQCQTATHPLVTTAGPAMTARNCIPAMRFASESSVTLSKKTCLEPTGGDVFAPQKRGRRSAERRTKSSCRASMGRRSRGPISGAARLSALLRGHAPGNPTRPGPRFLESPDANGRTLSGTSAASTSQSGTRRTGRCPNRLQAKSEELRTKEPHPLRQYASPVDVPYDERDGRRYSNPQRRCQRLFDLCRQIAGLRGAIAAVRKPERVSLHFEDSQKRSCGRQSRLSMPCESLRGCAAG